MENARYEIDESQGPVLIAGPFLSSVAPAEVTIRCERGNIYIGGEDDPLLEAATGFRMRTNDVMQLRLLPADEVWAMASGNNRRIHVLVVFG